MSSAKHFTQSAKCYDHNQEADKQTNTEQSDTFTITDGWTNETCNRRRTLERLAEKKKKKKKKLLGSFHKICSAKPCPYSIQ